MLIAIIAAAVLGFVAGSLLMLAWQQTCRKKERKRLTEQLKKLREQNIRLERERKMPEWTLPPIQENVPEEPVKVPQAPQSHPKRKTAPAINIPTEEEKPARPFSGVQELELVFQYMAPDGSFLRPGKGFLRNEQNELIPAEATLRMPNTTMGFAMGGMFYLYNVSYGGKVYNFQQILDREIGSGYVWLKRVRKPAVIQKSASNESYTLIRKGLIEVEDAS